MNDTENKSWSHNFEENKGKEKDETWMCFSRFIVIAQRLHL